MTTTVLRTIFPLCATLSSALQDKLHWDDKGSAMLSTLIISYLDFLVWGLFPELS